jgi:hypothetical protein
VGRDEVTARLQGDLEQVAGVETEDRAPVSGQVADPAQGGVEPGRRSEVGHVDQVVHLARAVVTLVDRRDLDAEHERRRRARLQRARQALGDLGLLGVAEQSGAPIDQVLAQVVEPGGVGEVAGAQQGDALAAGPPGQVGQGQITAASTREARMNVEVRDVRVRGRTCVVRGHALHPVTPSTARTNRHA